MFSNKILKLLLGKLLKQHAGDGSLEMSGVFLDGIALVQEEVFSFLFHNQGELGEVGVFYQGAPDLDQLEIEDLSDFLAGEGIEHHPRARGDEAGEESVCLIGAGDVRAVDEAG